MEEFATEKQIKKMWWNMLYRCLNPDHKAYKNYGGRGIKICDRWRNFKNFSEDIGQIKKGLEIDREDTNGNYEPGNIRFTTRSVNCANKRSTGKTGLKGVAKTKYGKYKARIGIKRKIVHLGSFDCPLLAVVAFDNVHRELYGF